MIEKWIKISDASKRFGIPVPTLKDWIAKGRIEYKQFIKGKGSPRYINELDIPSYLRKKI